MMKKMYSDVPLLDGTVCDDIDNVTNPISLSITVRLILFKFFVRTCIGEGMWIERLRHAS